MPTDPLTLPVAERDRLAAIQIIDLYPPMARCCICGKWDISKWGIPVSMETALIVGNDFEGDWAGKPACEICWRKHDAGKLVGHEPRY